MEENPAFNSDSIVNQTLIPFSSDTLTVSFTPLEVGVTTTNIIIETNDPNAETVMIPVFGVGLDKTNVENHPRFASNFKIGKAWPNPFNQICIIPVNASEPIQDKILVCNILRESINTASKYFNPVFHEIFKSVE